MTPKSSHASAHHHHTKPTHTSSRSSKTKSTVPKTSTTKSTVPKTTTTNAADHSSMSQYASYAWVQPTLIEDEDLQFGGKALSEWYEEDRSRLSCGGSDDGSSKSGSSGGGEERRGRQRTRSKR